MIIDESVYLQHIGVLRKSGRYPWGSGETQSQRNKTFLQIVAGLKEQGLTEKEITTGFSTAEHPFSVKDLRDLEAYAKSEEKAAIVNTALKLKEKGYGATEAGKKMGVTESTFRSLTAPDRLEKALVIQNTIKMLEDEMTRNKYLDVGSGNERRINLTRTKFDVALMGMKERGYKVVSVQTDVTNANNKTTVKVLAPEGTTYRDIVMNRGAIGTIGVRTDDGGKTFSPLGLLPPINVDSKRLKINYGEDGGGNADGVIYVRPGVSDLSLGKSRYAQVRIAVDGTHYLKGMAVYKADMPDGYDLVFNTPKANTGNKLDALKPLKTKSEADTTIDLDNPFGSMVTQLKTVDADGNQRLTSAINIVNEAGDWEKYSKTIATQVLSKQSPRLAKDQLDMTYEKRKKDLEEIKAYTNPVVRKKLLESYADDADAAAVHLKAAALPRQAWHVILPVDSLKENEIYAPNYVPGERVVLIRYPHGGIFEIPELIVNNSHPAAKKLLGEAVDAVGINSKVAEKLSGADFDGDTVLVIPNDHGKIKTSPTLTDLKNFDPKTKYKNPDGVKPISEKYKNVQMGVITNLINDMTIGKANQAELALAVKHSMVIIDAYKHNLNYRQSAIDNQIKHLQTKYQADPKTGKPQGASTLISRAKRDIYIPERIPRPAKDGGPIDKATGKKVFVETGAGHLNDKGVFIPKLRGYATLAVTDDAHTLSSGTKMEGYYADHSNRLKALANEARKEMVHTKTPPASPSARRAYATEVEQLNAALRIVEANRPLERRARLLSDAVVRARVDANPNMDAAELKKLKYMSLAEMRQRTGAQRNAIFFTDKQWEAVQAGAISPTKLKSLLDASDLTRVKSLATPKTVTLMTSAKTNRAKNMVAQGFSQGQIADALGVSLTTLKTSLKDG